MSRGALLLPLVVAASLLLSGCFGGVASDWAFRLVHLRDPPGELTGKGIRVAIVDTGIDAGHPSLDHATIIWRDEINGRPEPYDDVGHGSHVAGILMGRGASFGGSVQGYELRGAAPDVTLIVVKAIRAEDGKGPTSGVANGITFAVNNDADVICLSLGTNPSALDLLPNDINGAVNSAVNRGILVVASAGNIEEGSTSDEEQVKVPANIELVVAVGAVDERRAVAGFSARGDEDLNQGPFGTGLGGRADPNKKPEIVAPGVKIRSAWKEGGYATASGTSQAAPFVCGAFALLLQKCSSLRAQNSSSTVATVKNALMRTAAKIPGQRTPHDNAAGYGLLQARELLDSFGTSC